ncbi:Hypp711 [Branchiostoma lanceolatum]|uniref:Hypp711 protein n=1 Tax=Branchiostoma lanceolatum TaxID=7740 RepID=A0A8J9W1H0_BRALA|nr:Hypp711 [Branchiostoma lanceolatum]
MIFPTSEDLQDFAVREEELICLHARAAKQTINTSTRVEEEDEGSDDETVDQLQTSPFLAAANDGETYGIPKRIGQGGRLCCMMCSSRQMSCSHVERYKEWCRDRYDEKLEIFPQHLVPYVYRLAHAATGTTGTTATLSAGPKWIQHAGGTIYTRYTTIVGHHGPD